jgi:hypothetical protein
MTIYELLIDRSLGAEQIQAALAKTYGLSPDQVAVVEDIASWNSNDAVHIVAEASAITGDFVQGVVLYLRDLALANIDEATAA